MKSFLDNNFILETKTAESLYHEYAEKMPIIDYHCHLVPKEIADNIKYDNLAQAWLGGDHYKWRAMRANGIDEKFITGNASDYQKFEKWAETVPCTLRNPLYHWTHMELKSYFNITKLLNSDTAKEIYKETSVMLQSDDFSVRNLMINSNVEVVCTTDDPTDSLEHHKKIADDSFKVKVLPTWRPDKAMAVENLEDYKQYIKKLGQSADIEIQQYQDLIDALKKRHNHFHQQGCRLSDHGLDTFYATDHTESEIKIIFKKAIEGKTIDQAEINKFKSCMLIEFGRLDYEKGWTQQFHVGAMRNNNTRMVEKLGPDTGYDSIGDKEIGTSLSKFLNSLEKEGKLAKTILYNLNPVDNDLLATMIGNFQDGSIPGKMQFGSGWWFLDQKNGMENQINSLSTQGLLSRFVGMLTDSRSFLSYPRHEYFRRILCNLIGNDVENGLIPNDIKLLGKMVEDICYNNAKGYFGF